ncbi:BapA/Bap/LapF family prefix-like domain-containing protein, partial [Sulfitobacter sp.]|uniref:BapA/Bap/LapF family prefix-like domain-containing protein n=1 Tax=Sulfitobacter sp. TaxID=1903071 RepID=UPI003F6B4BAB
MKEKAGQEISLNLRQTDFLSQQRVGNDLVMTMADGSVITIENYFNDTGAANRLFISSDGYLSEVAFIEGEGGSLFAQYGPTEQWGKWSPSDDLIYLGYNDISSILDGILGSRTDDVSMLAAPLLGVGLIGGGGAAAAAVVVGGAAVISGGGGGGGSVAAPFVNEPESSTTVGGDGADKTGTVTGGGEPGADVVVIIGDKQVETTIGTDGTFEAIFTGDNFPADGNYEVVVEVTTGGTTATLDGPTFVIDTTAPITTVLEGTQSVSDFFNGESFAQGVTINGNGEAGSSIDVTVGGVTRSTTVDENGAWSVTFESGAVQGGEYQ